MAEDTTLLCSAYKSAASPSERLATAPQQFPMLLVEGTFDDDHVHDRRDLGLLVVLCLDFSRVGKKAFDEW